MTETMTPAQISWPRPLLGTPVKTCDCGSPTQPGDRTYCRRCAFKWSLQMGRKLVEQMRHLYGDATPQKLGWEYE